MRIAAVVLGNAISLLERCSERDRLAIMRKFSAGGATPVYAGQMDRRNPGSEDS